MKYKKFIIERYKGITSPITIDLTKNSLFPIIGINECGKTTILNAIFSFDCFNDENDATIRHLTDVNNLYTTENKSARISAVIQTDKEELKKLISSHFKKNRSKYLDRKFKYPRNSGEISEIEITRILTKEKKTYEADFPGAKEIIDINAFCTDLMKELPFILYFDDFKDSFPDQIEISDDENENWFSIIDQLFQQTNESYDVSKLPSIESRRRKSILSDVQNHLNQTLTKEWANFRLDDKDLLEIAIDYAPEDTFMETVSSTPPYTEKIKVTKHFLKFEVIDKDKFGNKRHFYVRDRSKGFYWFFNFVMKLEFNPKINGSENNSIYLLDEPGSYLHSFAQTKLCKKLKELSERNKVLYCTHSHYLLNPQIIPLNKIHVAHKSDSGRVELTNYHNLDSSDRQLPTAFQPIFDALQLQPIPFELTQKKTLLVEGIYDFYSFSLFKENRELNIMPCKNAESISSFISMMIGFGVDYKALWDNDTEGLLAVKLNTKYFGEDEAKNHFFVLPLEGSGTKRIIQDLFNGEDLVKFRKELGLNDNTSFEKTIASLFFSNKKMTIIEGVSKKTTEAFKKVFDDLGL